MIEKRKVTLGSRFVTKLVCGVESLGSSLPCKANNREILITLSKDNFQASLLCTVVIKAL